MSRRKCTVHKIYVLFALSLISLNAVCAADSPHIQVRSITKTEFEKKYSQRYIEPETTVIVSQEAEDGGSIDPNEPTSSKRHIKKLAQIKQMLQGRVVFGEPSKDDPNADVGIVQIRPMDKHKKVIDIPKNELWLTSYFPDYEIIVYEGGHMYEGAYDLRTGDSEALIGSPNDFLHSPSGKWRVSGNYNGQECHDYFLAKRGEYYLGVYNYTPVHRFKIEQFCAFERAYWLNDSEFYVEEFDYQHSNEREQKHKYSKITIGF